MGSQDTISTEAFLFIEVKESVYRYRFSVAVTSVGSADDNNVRIREPSVAAHHLLITYVDGKFYARRVGTEPVRINGEMLENYSEELQWGDVVGVGDVRLRIGEGGKISETAILFEIIPHSAEDVRPYHLLMTRKTAITIGDPPADIVLPGAVAGLKATIENQGAAMQYLVPPEGDAAKLHLNEVLVTKRARLKDKDVIRLRGCTLKLRILRGEIMADPECILSPDTFKRFSMGAERKR
jgi:hypothetical protein